MIFIQAMYIRNVIYTNCPSFCLESYSQARFYALFLFAVISNNQGSRMMTQSFITIGVLFLAIQLCGMYDFHQVVPVLSPLWTYFAWGLNEA